MICTKYARGRTLNDDAIPRVVGELRNKYKQWSDSELEPLARTAIIEHNQQEIIRTKLSEGRFSWTDNNDKYHSVQIEDVIVDKHRDRITIAMVNGDTMVFNSKDFTTIEGEYSSDLEGVYESYLGYSGNVLNSRYMSDADVDSAFLDADVTSGSISDIMQKMKAMDIDALGSSWDSEHSERLGVVVQALFSVNDEIKKLGVKTTLGDVERYMEPLGEYDPNTNEVRIVASTLGQAARSRLTMTNEETLAHETVHAALSWVFGNIAGVVGSDLKRLARELYQTAKKELKVEDFLPEHGGIYNEIERAKAQELYDYMFNGKLGDYSVQDAEIRLQEFLALATTNKTVIAALEKLESKARKSVVKENETVFDKVLRWITDAIYKGMYALKSNKIKGKTLDEEATKLVVQLAKIHGEYGSKAAYNTGFPLDDAISEKLNKATDWTDKQMKGLVDGLFEKLGIAADGAKAENIEKVAKLLESIEKDWDKVSDKGTLKKSYFLVKSLPKMRVIYQISNLNQDVRQDILADWSRILYKMKMGEDSFIQNLLADFTAGRETLQDITSMTMQFRSHIDRMREQGYKGTLSHIKEGFTKLDIYAAKNMKYNQAITSVLINADVQALDMSAEELRELLKDSKKLEAEIASAEEMIMQEMPLPEWTMDQTQQMASYMITGLGLRTNAENIVRRFGTMSAIAYTNGSVVDDAQIKMVDRLGSLYALRDTWGKNEMQELIALDSKAVEHVLMLSRGVQKVTKQDWRDSGLMQEMVKGQSHAMNNRDKGLEIAPMSKMAEMKANGYEFIREVKVDTADSDGGAYGLYVTHNTGVRSRVDGGTGLQRVHIPGLLLSDKVRMNHKELNDRDAFVKFINVREKAITRMLAGRSSGEMHPVYNEEGEIIDFRYNLGKLEEIQYLEQETRGTEVLARSYGQAHTQAMTDENNRELIDIILKDSKDLDDSGKIHKDNSHLYLKISANEINISQEVREKLLGVKGSIFTEVTKYGIKTEGESLWALLPPDAKKYIIEQNNAEDLKNRLPKGNRRELYIRKDLLKQLFGYEELSITDAGILRNVSELSKTKIRVVENYVKDFVGLLKGNVVVKLPSTFMGNIWSNAKFLWYAGIPMGKSVQYLLMSRRMLVKWKADEVEMGKLQRLVDGSSGTDFREYKKRLADLQAEMKDNPLNRMMELGWYQSVTEDVNLADDTNSVVSSANKALNKIVGEEGFVHDVVQTAFLTRKSKLGHALIQITQESDFHFRAATYWWGLEQVKKQEGSLTTNEAKKKVHKLERTVTSNFINYSSVINSPFIQMLDRFGPEAFWKYFSGIQRVTVQRAKENTTRVLADLAGQAMFDLPSSIYQSSIVMQLMNRLNPIGRVRGLLTNGTDLPISHLVGM